MVILMQLCNSASGYVQPIYETDVIKQLKLFNGHPDVRSCAAAAAAALMLCLFFSAISTCQQFFMHLYTRVCKASACCCLRCRSCIYAYIHAYMYIICRLCRASFDAHAQHDICNICRQLESQARRLNSCTYETQTFARKASTMVGSFADIIILLSHSHVRT